METKSRRRRSWRRSITARARATSPFPLSHFLANLLKRKNKTQNNSSMSKVPEFWGRDSPYHGGTEFLGTPSDHLEVRKKRKREREREVLFLSLSTKTTTTTTTETHTLFTSSPSPTTTLPYSSSPPRGLSPRTSSRSTASPSTTGCRSTR